jgi:hypothetical protein
MISKVFVLFLSIHTVTPRAELTNVNTTLLLHNKYIGEI